MATVEPLKRELKIAPIDAAGCNVFGIAPALIWRLRGGDNLRWAYFGDDEFIAFDATSGQTHLLDALSAEVVDRLSAGEAAQSELVGLLRDLVGGVGPVATMLDRVLAGLSACGLVEAAGDVGTT